MVAEPREVCGRCRRPRAACYCAALPSLDTRTRVVILQHPRERDVPIGTARMASLCLPRATLHVGVRWADASLFHADPARPPILLYPGPGARDILREPPVGPVTLVVVDGTWSQAKTVVRDNPVLHALPRYAFRAPEKSEYRIRREPDDDYTSTIEALMHVLGALEGDPERFRALLAPFRAMVDFQLACQARSPRRRARQPRAERPPRRRVPDAIVDRFGDLVAVYGEANAWPYVAGGRRGDDELVHWVAERVATGDRFEALAAPTGELAPSTVFHTGLDEAQLLAAGTRADLVAAFARFVRPSDIALGWGTHSFDLMRAASADALPRELVDARALVKRAANARVGSLEDHASHIAPTAAPRDAGRANRRLAMLVAAIRRLHDDAAAIG
jgi:DTW domain-containing protein YfiP|nr:tRNA-uridine aminocarboxypropyltransferase [Kofleriaceae bacterium]